VMIDHCLLMAHHMVDGGTSEHRQPGRMTEQQLPIRNFAITLACIFATRVYTRSPD
jgi:hypothetical protein